MPKIGGYILSVAILIFVIGVVVGIFKHDTDFMFKSYAIFFLLAVIGGIVGCIEINSGR